MAHVGDMGNAKADDKGHAHVEVMLGAATITGKNAIIGRGVILHAKADDFSQPVGNAGRAHWRGCDWGGSGQEVTDSKDRVREAHELGFMGLFMRE